jgi:DNA polymerase III subunit epsilon
MKRKFLAQIAATALAVGATSGLPSLAAGQTMPPMGGGYKDVIPIPVDDPTTKAIAGALFKPAGTGPFPVVVYMSGCAGLTYPSELVLERTAVDHLLARGVATLIVDPFTPRNEPEGVCANLNEKTRVQYWTRARSAARRLPGHEKAARDATAPLQSGDVLMLLSIKRRVHQYLLRDPAFRFLFDEPPPGEAVAIDCETTGLNTRKDDIVTIAAIRIRGSRILASERFESMVKPNARMKAEAIKVHHLHEGDVAGGRTMEQVLPELLRYIGSRPLVGYYPEFDLAMVNKHMRRMLGIELPNARIEVSGLHYERKYGDAPPGTQIVSDSPRSSWISTCRSSTSTTLSQTPS